jgi:hypothetical protein
MFTPRQVTSYTEASLSCFRHGYQPPAIQGHPKTISGRDRLISPALDMNLRNGVSSIGEVPASASTINGMFVPNEVQESMGPNGVVLSQSSPPDSSTSNINALDSIL